MKLLLCIALGVLYMASMANSQAITFDESKLCVSYQIGITWINAPSGAKITFQNPITQLASFSLSTTNGTKWLYFLPTQDQNYDAYMFDSGNQFLYGNTYTGPAPCTNLETYGLETEKQAVVILNYVRKLNSLPILYWHSALQSYSEYLANNNKTACDGGEVNSFGYAYSSLSCNIVSLSTYDPGSLVQSMINRNEVSVTSSSYNEVGFGYNAAYKNWRYVLGTRFASCKNGYIDASEGCDTGSTTDSGCVNCQVTAGYTCSNGVFTMGSTCSVAPHTPTTPVAQAPTTTPSATPIASQPPSATPTASPPVNSPSATPVANAPSATPTATPSAGNTPTGGVTPSATPSATPVTSTPSSTPSGGTTPSASPVDQGTPSTSQSPDSSSAPSSTPSDVTTPSDSTSPSTSSGPASAGETPSAGPVKNAPFEGTPKPKGSISSASKACGIVLAIIMSAAVFIL